MRHCRRSRRPLEAQVAATRLCISSLSRSTRAGTGPPFYDNRWVTGETWYRAEDVIRMLDGFQ